MHELFFPYINETIHRRRRNGQGWLLREEVEDWLAENVGQRYHRDFGLQWTIRPGESADRKAFYEKGFAWYHGSVIVLQRKEHAIMFKLAWGGSLGS